MPAEQAAAADQAKLIYLICDEKDRKATVPIRKFCRGLGFEVAIPAFEGDATAVREAHQQLLTNCDAVILFYGCGDEGWKRTIDNRSEKRCRATGVGSPYWPAIPTWPIPCTSDKEDLIDMEEPNLIKGFGELFGRGHDRICAGHDPSRAPR